MASGNRPLAQNGVMGKKNGLSTDHTWIDLLEEIEHEGDARRAYARVQQRLSVYRAQGTDVPEQLLSMERALAFDCMAESQGR